MSQNMPKRILQGQSGVVLIEALLGILIFSIGILALIGMQSVAVKNTVDARYRTEAAYLASGVVSQMRLDMANLTLYPDSNTSSYAPRTAWRNQVEAMLPGINIASVQRVPSISLVPGPTYAGDADAPSQITVVVRWLQPGETQERKFEIVSMLSRDLP
jgi:type IV pilus assembly protein PilV